MSTPYIFLSYKSNDANLVRSIAEWLLSRGVSVWFAEYTVLPENYDEFQEEIDLGIRNSTHAVFFSNDLWNQSEYCQYELNNLEKRLKQNCILEVRLPNPTSSNKGYLKTNFHPYVEFNGDVINPNSKSINSIGEKICNSFEIQFDKQNKAIQLENNLLKLNNSGVIVDLMGFQASIKDYSSPISSDFTRPTLLFRKNIYNIPVTLVLVILPFENVPQFVSIEENIDDRAIYHTYREYSKKWMNDTQGKNSGIKQTPVGLHLFFKDKRSNMGLTYYSPQKRKGFYNWERRYALTIKDKYSKMPGEINLIFLAGLNGGHSEQFKKFCSLCPHFDKIANAIEYETPNGKEAFTNTLPIAFMCALYLFGLSYLLHKEYNKDESILTITLIGICTGIFLGLGMNLFVNRALRRHLWMYQPISNDLINESIYERIANGTVCWIYMTPIIALASLFNILSNNKYILFSALILAFILLSLKIFGGKPFIITPCSIIAGVALHYFAFLTSLQKFGFVRDE